MFGEKCQNFPDTIKIRVIIAICVIRDPDDPPENPIILFLLIQTITPFQPKFLTKY